jgi:hypothetical protein
MKKKLFFSFTLLSNLLYSQDFNYAITQKKNIISVGNNWTGYERISSLFNSTVLFGFSPIFKGSLGSKSVLTAFGIDLNGRIVLINRGIKIVSGLNIRIQDNNSYSFNLLHFDAKIPLIFGYYRKKWFLATDINCILPLIRHIKFHFDHFSAHPYMNNVYNFEENGWYNPKLIFFTSGFQAGYTYKERVDFILKFKKNISSSSTIGYAYNVKDYQIGFQLNYRFQEKAK